MLFCLLIFVCQQAFKKLVTDIKDLEGLPPTALGLAAQQARSAGHEQATAEAGPWLLTLDFPSYYPVLTHAKNRCDRGAVMFTCCMSGVLGWWWLDI
jgi:Zn-dependent oligopeptidase